MMELDGMEIVGMVPDDPELKMELLRVGVMVTVLVIVVRRVVVVVSSLPEEEALVLVPTDKDGRLDDSPILELAVDEIVG